jgi:hypothetical protein
MNKFIKLSKINKDIELLETYGDFKAADVLHKQFLKVSQLVSNEVKTPEKFMDELYLLAGNPNDDFENLVKWYQNDPGRYSEEEREYIDKAVEKATGRRNRLGKFTTVINPDNPTLVSVENEPDESNGNDTKDKTNEDTTVKKTGPKMPILDEREQGYVYRRIVGQIKRLLKENKKERADKLAKDYQDFFENPGSNEKFIKQVNRIYKELQFKSPLQ